ncbi:MAG TPA: hypothetical protein VF163_01175 [Micromonosporaceae bacterium]
MGGGGFPAGLDTMAPGPRLAAVLAGIGRDGLSGAQVAVLVRAQGRQLAYQEAMLLADVGRLAAQPWDASGRTSPEREDEFATDQVGFTLTWTTYTAGMWINVGRVLSTRLPMVYQALAAGRIDWYRARAFVDGLALVDDTTAATIATQLLPVAQTLNAARLRARLRYQVVKANPALARRRYQQSITQRRVQIGLDHDGTASVSATNLPVDRAAAADDWLDRLARAAKHAGDTRTLSQLRADAALDLLAGLPFTTTPSCDPITTNADHNDRDERQRLRASFPTPPASNHAEPGGASNQDRSRAGDHETGTGRADQPPAATAATVTAGSAAPTDVTMVEAASADVTMVGGAATTELAMVGRGASADVTMVGGTATTDMTMVGGTASAAVAMVGRGGDQPGEPEDSSMPEQLRRLVPAAWVHDPTQAEPDQTDQARRIHPHLHVPIPDRTEPNDARQCVCGGIRPADRRGVVDLVIEATTLMGLNDNPGHIPGWGACTDEVARQIAFNPLHPPQWRWNIVDDHANLLAVIPTRRRPTHRDQIFVQTRDRTCRAPGCGRKAIRCDQDHQHPYTNGGPTNPCNLWTLCRRHHRMKHQAGFTIGHLTGNTFFWHAPDGRLYLTTPNDHPLLIAEHPDPTTGTYDLDHGLPPQPVNQINPAG